MNNLEPIYKQQAASLKRKLANSFKHDSATNEDVLQQVFANVLASGADLSEPVNYLTRACFNTGKRAYTKQRREVPIEVKDWMLNYDPQELLEDERKLAFVTSLVSTLTPKQAAVFTCILNGMWFEEAAAELGIGFESVKTHYKLGLVKLREGARAYAN